MSTAAEPFASASTYTNSTGVYAGTVSTVDTNTNTYTGEWLQIQIPYPIILSTYSLQAPTNLSNTLPNIFYVLGSKDGQNWTLVNSQTAQTWSAVSVINTYTVTGAQAYSYYRLVCNKTNGNTTLNIDQWTLNGTEASLTIGADGQLGIGVTNPVQELEVAGNAKIYGSLSLAGNISKTYLLNGSIANGGPSIYWNFSNNFTDSSGNGYNGTLTGNAGTYSTTNTVSTLSGSLVNYFSFYNSNMNLASTLYALPTAAKTISYWVNTTRTVGSVDCLTVGFNGTGNLFGMMFGPSSYSDLAFVGDGNDFAVSSSSFAWANTGAWTHVVLTCDLTNMAQIYINGNPVCKYYTNNSSLLSTGTYYNPKFPVNYVTTTNYFSISTFGFSASFQAGVKYNIRSALYYTRCLMPDEITSLYYNT